MRNKKLIALFIILGSLTVLAILSSVIFSIQKITGYCYNDDDTQLISMIEDTENNGIKKGKSIFFLNEGNVIKKIEENPDFANVKVINIERKFPNRVYINFIKIYPFIAYEYDGTIYFASNDLVILDTKPAGTAYEGYIRLVADIQPSGTEKGKRLFDVDSDVYLIVNGVITSIQRLDYNDAISMIEFIDMRATYKGFTYVKMRTGVYFKIYSGLSNLFEKVRLAMSVYASDDGMRSVGLFRIYDAKDSASSILATYSEQLEPDYDIPY